MVIYKNMKQDCDVVISQWVHLVWQSLCAV